MCHSRRLKVSALPFAAAVALLVGGQASTAHGQPGDTEQQKRQQILDALGLKRAPSNPPAAVAAPAAGDGDTAAPAPATAPSTPGHAKAVVPWSSIHPLLMQACQPCHREGGPAGATRFHLHGDRAADLEVAKPLITPGHPATSLLLIKASGQGHGGGAVWAPSTRPYRQTAAWILEGAMSMSPVAANEAVASGRASPPAGMSARKVSGKGVAGKSAAPLAAAPVAAAASPGTPSLRDATAATASPAPVPAPAPVNRGDATGSAVAAVLQAHCSACHAPGAMAGSTRFLVAGSRTEILTSAAAMTTPRDALASLLLNKAQGQQHGGGAVLPADSADFGILRAWVEQGAVVAVDVPAAPPTASPSSLSPSPPGPAQGSQGAPTAGAMRADSQPLSSHPAQPGGSPFEGLLPAGFYLNGRFDLNYERRALKDTPFGDGDTALRSYHHFLFLSRETADDPLGFTAEITSLQFWEAHLRWSPKVPGVRVLFKAGKLLVPFGTEPLFHQNYGGLAGFDQKVLPAIWAEEGFAIRTGWQQRELALTSDLYVVRGYRLKTATAVLNLQSDISPDDEVRAAVGHRLTASWGPASGYYSLLVNPLGFDRRLVMQAVDVTMARLRGVPLLDHLSFAVGLLRADVSGGGPGQDYYHFANYLQVRFYPTAWLYVQYRGGVRTFNNRRGVWIDDTRLTNQDASTHSLTVAARWRGLLASTGFFWNLEKVDEIRDDFFRVTVAYEF